MEDFHFLFVPGVIGDQVSDNSKIYFTVVVSKVNFVCDLVRVAQALDSAFPLFIEGDCVFPDSPNIGVFIRLFNFALICGSAWINFKIKLFHNISFFGWCFPPCVLEDHTDSLISHSAPGQVRVYANLRSPRSVTLRGMRLTSRLLIQAFQPRPNSFSRLVFSARGVAAVSQSIKDCCPRHTTRRWLLVPHLGS